MGYWGHGGPWGSISVSNALLFTLAAVKKHYQCDVCDFSTTVGHCFKMHKKSHLICDKCGKHFSGEFSKRNLERHLKKHEKNENKTLYECTRCHKLFQYKCRYDSHIQFTKKCRPPNS